MTHDGKTGIISTYTGVEQEGRAELNSRGLLLRGTVNILISWLNFSPSTCRNAMPEGCDILEAWIEQKPFEEDYYIVREGELAPQYR